MYSLTNYAPIIRIYAFIRSRMEYVIVDPALISYKLETLSSYAKNLNDKVRIGEKISIMFKKKQRMIDSL